VGSRAAYQTPESDSEIFFGSVFGAALVLLLNEGLCSLVFHSANGTLGPSLLSRTVPITSVRLIYTLLVLLPAFVAFAAIGVPFFLRTLASAVKGRLAAGSRRGLILLALCTAIGTIELHFGRDGSIAVTAIAVIGLVLGFPTIAGIGREHGFRLLAAAGLSLAGLAWYESRVAAGIDVDLALTPAALVAAGFFATAGLATATAALVPQGSDGRLRVVGCWLAAVVWVAVPLVRSHLVANPILANRLELGSLAAGAVALMALSMFRRRPREFHS